MFHEAFSLIISLYKLSVSNLCTYVKEEVLSVNTVRYLLVNVICGLLYILQILNYSTLFGIHAYVSIVSRPKPIETFIGHCDYQIEHTMKRALNYENSGSVIIFLEQTH